MKTGWMAVGVLGGVALVFLIGAGHARAGLINGSFETTNPDIPPDSSARLDASGVPGWRTTAPDNRIEIRGTGFDAFGPPVPSYDGRKFAELNANFASTLYQDATGISAGSLVGFQFAHRGRNGIDIMRLTITDLGADNVLGGGNDSVLFTKEYASGNTAWSFYTNAGEMPIVAQGNTVRFAYEAVFAVGGNTQGNFIDAADFGVGVGAATPEPASLALLGFGALGIAGYAWRRRKKAAA